MEDVKAWQAAHGLEPDGVIGPITRAAMHGTPYLPPLLHPMPRMYDRWGYQHLQPWPERDPVWLEICGGSSWLAGMMRLLTSTDHAAGTVSRGPASVISLDTISVGIAHWWAGTAERVLAAVAATPGGVEAWGAKHAAMMQRTGWAIVALGQGKGKVRLRPDLYGLAAGWAWLHRSSRYRFDAIRAQVDLWVSDYVERGRSLAQGQGWAADLDGPDGALILGACVRLCNSGAAARRIGVGRRKAGADATAREVLRHTYLTPRAEGGYDKQDRWARLTSDAAFSGPAPRRIDTRRDLTWRIPDIDRAAGG